MHEVIARGDLPAGARIGSDCPWQTSTASETVIFEASGPPSGLSFGRPSAVAAVVVHRIKPESTDVFEEPPPDPDAVV